MLNEENVEASVCVLCGMPWEPSIKNLCECGGFCTWGPAKGASPTSWNVTDQGWSPKAPEGN